MLEAKVKQASRRGNYPIKWGHVEKYSTVDHMPNLKRIIFKKYSLVTLKSINKPTIAFDVYGSVPHNTSRIEITNKMRPCSKIYYSNVS
jgi:hypothetical protein